MSEQLETDFEHADFVSHSETKARASSIVGTSSATISLSFPFSFSHIGRFYFLHLSYFAVLLFLNLELHIKD